MGHAAPELRSAVGRAAGLRGVPKATEAQTDHQRLLAAGYCSFLLIGTESLFVHASEIGRMRSNLGSAAETSDFVHPGFCSADPFRKRLFTWAAVDSPRWL